MNHTRRICFLAAFLVLGLMLSYAEHLLPLNLGVPGIKLGLPNLLVILLLYAFSPADAALVNLARILIAGIWFGNLFGAVYSLCGGLLSFAGMLLVKRLPRVTPVGVGIAGGFLHNLGQMLAAMVLTSPYLYPYLPVLLLAGIGSGLLTGFGARLLLPRVQALTRASGAH